MLIKSLFWQIINSIVKICLEIFVFDRKIRRILKGNWAKFYLRKYVVKGCNCIDTPHPLPSLSPQETSLPLNGCCGREQSIKESLYPSLKGRGNCNKLRRIMSGLEFDPGFAPYILAFRGTVEYLYMDINRFKNLSQKKMKFKQYYKKMLDMFNNNLGFYVGCLMWAAYIKTQPEQEILNNNCLGQEYNEEENISDTEFMIKFLELLPKDVKYFLGQNYEINQSDMKILELY